MNSNLHVVDAEDSNSHTAHLGYDVNEQVERVYQFNLDEDVRLLDMPPMLKEHRTVIFKQAKKLGLVYESGPKPANESLPAPSTLRKPKNYKRKIWESAYGPKSKHERKSDKLPVGASEVIEGFMWLGSGRDADNVDDLLDKRITHVLNVTSEWRESPRYRDHQIVFRRLVIKDFVTESIAGHFESAFAFIDQCRDKGGRIFIHCVVGKSRSSSVVLAYLMKTENQLLREAFEHVKRTRDFIRPNDNFLTELQRYEKELHPHVESPSLVHEDLPAMKDPGTVQKKRDQQGQDFLREHVSEHVMLQVLGDLDATRKNYDKFVDALTRYLEHVHRAQVKQLGWSHKSFRKFLLKSVHVKEWYDNVNK